MGCGDGVKRKGAAWGAGDACIPPQVFFPVCLCRLPVPPYHSSTFNYPFPHSLPSFLIPPHLTPSHPILSLHAIRIQRTFRAGTGVMLLLGTAGSHLSASLRSALLQSTSLTSSIYSSPCSPCHFTSTMTAPVFVLLSLINLLILHNPLLSAFLPLASCNRF